MTAPATATLSVEPRVILTELKDGTGLLLHLGTKVYFTLNESGVFVWKALAESPRTRGALVEAMVARYEASPDAVERDVETMLRELIDEELVHAR